MGDRVLTAQQILGLDQLSDVRFRSRHNLDNQAGRTFGGQLIALALRASHLAGVTWPVHNCSALFLKSASLDQPVEFSVEAMRDGGRYAMRRIAAFQNGIAVADLLASFHMQEEGLAHQTSELGDVPPPEEVPALRDYVQTQGHRLAQPAIDFYSLDFPIEMRVIRPDAFLYGEGDASQISFWFRIASADAIDDPNDHACLVAMMSDWWLAVAPLMHHREETIAKQNLGVAATNHSLWMHAPARADQWLLCRASSPWAGHRRSLSSGLVFDRSGTLIASATQELAMPKTA